MITLTVGAPKRGLIDHPCVGRLEVADDVGLVHCPFETDLVWTQGPPARLPARAVDANKGTFGHAAIFAGSLGYHGAAVLAANGALRAQPGLVSVYPQTPVYAPVACQLQAAMAHPWQQNTAPPKNCTAMVFGPGMAAEDVPDFCKEAVREHWRKSPQAIIVDASALDWLRPGAALKDAIRVITPHPGEAGRMLGSSAREVQEDRVAALRELSKRFGNCWVVLKGRHTLVGRRTGPVFINGSGNPYLAQGGSGDLLSGYLVGLLAQPAWQENAASAIRFAVWKHGAAADALAQTQLNWTVEDLARRLGA